MGMGEPLLNFEQLKKAINILNDKSAFNFSKRRITLSTCGIAEELYEIAANPSFFPRLALSLTTADENLRHKLMPITKNNPLKKVYDALKLYQKNGGARLTLEIPLLGGINTTKKDADSIIKFAKGLDTIVNLIPWNPVEGLEFEGKQLCEPDKKEIHSFKEMLEKGGLKTTRRLHKGQNISGACGQLGTDS